MKVFIQAVLLFSAFALMAKIHMANDINKSFKEDPLEQWIASGVMILLINEANKYNRK